MENQNFIKTLTDKPIDQWTEQDLINLQNYPKNFESPVFEYKVKYHNSDEFRKDVVSIANNQMGYIIFGIADDPFKIHGLERREIDELERVITQVLDKNIDPILNPKPIYEPIPLKNQKNVLVVQIFPKERGIYGIRQNNNPSRKGYNLYEFWIRKINSKQIMTTEEVINRIIENDPYKKKVKLKFSISKMSANDISKNFFSIIVTNPTMRIIHITHPHIEFFHDSDNEWYKLPEAGYLEHLALEQSISDKFPSILNDGEDGYITYDLERCKPLFKDKNFSFPVKTRAKISTKSGVFYSEEKELTEEFEFN